MNIVQITPGAGGMYCGNCFRDNSLVRALRQLGHETLLVPLYLPMTLEEEDQSAGTPIFFGGVSVYLEQLHPVFRRMPGWLHRLLASPRLLKWAAGRAAKTRAEDVGDLMLSMLRGEEGNQARELDELAGWLKHQMRPDVICLSNALLVGLVRRLRRDLGAPIICMLQGEDAFLDSLPPEHRERSWQTLAARAAEVDLFIAPSRYFAQRMGTRLGLPPERLRVVYNGINLEGFGSDGAPAPRPAADSAPPVIGYFARMCREKGLDTLVAAFLELKRRPGFESVRLRVGGGCGPGDEKVVRGLQAQLRAAGLTHQVSFHPNVDRAGKLAFFRGLTVFSVPALYGEAFGLYVIEALAAGVPVVQPSVASFPELIEATQGGVLCPPGDAVALADGLESLLRRPTEAADMGRRAQARVREKFSLERMATDMIAAYASVASRGITGGGRVATS
ncbi:MAG TPA: glycosyltransferase family 4 protein [Methylomirabilota bacterium]|nr:glycosyltransferase family 4 protein [Methylomirabilota bacterium]